MFRQISAATLLSVLSAPGFASTFEFPSILLDRVESGAYRPSAPRPSAEAVVQPLDRLAPADYADGVGAPAGVGRPNPRELANALNAPALAGRDARPMSNLSVAFSQLMASHETALSPTGDERMDTPVAADDPIAEDAGGAPVMIMNRSLYHGGTGPGDPRQPVSKVTPYFDASTVYGSTSAAEARLRDAPETGRLKTGPGWGLPLIDGRIAAGDDRAPENALLHAFHALYLREHNRLADGLRAACDSEGRACSGDDIYHTAQRIVAGGQQKVFYEEYLPLFLGADDLRSLVPDQSLFDAPGGVLTEFSTAAGRLGHSQVPATLSAVTPGSPKRVERIEDCLFTGTCLAGADLGAVLLGATQDPADPVDTLVTDGLRNGQIPGPGSAILIDLEATNIARGRDHGLADYAAVRAALGFRPQPLDELLPAAVLDLYAPGVGIDLLTGLLAEYRPSDSYLGQTAAAIWGLQFEWLKADPDFYTRLAFDDPLRLLIDDTTMSGLIARNTGLAPDLIGRTPFLASTGPQLAAVPLPPALPALVLAVLTLFAARRRRLSSGEASPPKSSAARRFLRRPGRPGRNSPPSRTRWRLSLPS